MNMRLLVAFGALLTGASVAHSQSELENILSPARLPYLKDSRLIQIASTDTSGGNNDYIVIKDSATAVLADIRGPGVITQFWVTISSPDKYFLRRILLRIFWDGEDSPSVEAPIGDFFGTGLEYKQFVTPFIGMSSGGYYCYFPMPFRKSARVEVVNQTGQPVWSFYYHIDYQKLARAPEPNVAYFHAQWRREIRTDPQRNYTILEARGRGQFVGVAMSMQSHHGSLGFLEGNEMIYVDGEGRPSVAGTGTEDYFNSGWYFNRGEFAAPYHGLILKDDSLARIAAYRLQIADAIPFSKSLRVTIEHGMKNEEDADYSSTAYWYQLEPHRRFEPILPPGLRIPLRVEVRGGALEAESLEPQNTSLPWTVEDMSPYGADWSAFKQLKVSARAPGEEFSLALPAVEDRYDVDMYVTRGNDYGNADVFHDGEKVGEIHGYGKALEPAGNVTLSNLKTTNKALALRFVVSGKDSRSTGYSVGLDAFTLRPHRNYIPEWYLIGPFPNPRDANSNRLGLDSVYAPEKEIDLQKSYSGVDGQSVRWFLQKTPKNGRVDLYMFDPYEQVVAYALTYVHSPVDQTLPLLLGSDDGVKVFLNDREIHRVLTVRIAVPDQDRVALELKKGWNKLLLKIENNFGGYDFFARVLDPDDSLTYSAAGEQ